MTKFHDFTRPEGYDVLARDFQDLQALALKVSANTRQARQRAQNWREFNDLVERYQDLYGAMMKHLFSAKKHGDVEKVRSFYSAKLAPLLKKLEEAERKVKNDVLDLNTSPVLDTAASPAAVARTTVEGSPEEKVRDIESMAGEVKEMAERLNDPNIPPDPKTLQGMIDRAKDMLKKATEVKPVLEPAEVK